VEGGFEFGRSILFVEGVFRAVHFVYILFFV